MKYTEFPANVPSKQSYEGIEGWPCSVDNWLNDPLGPSIEGWYLILRGMEVHRIGNGWYILVKHKQTQLLTEKPESKSPAVLAKPSRFVDTPIQQKIDKPKQIANNIQLKRIASPQEIASRASIPDTNCAENKPRRLNSKQPDP